MKRALTTTGAILLLAASGCRTVPITDRTQLMLSFEDTENEQGLAAYNEYIDKYKVTTNTAQQQLLQKVGNAIKDVAGDTGFDWEFNVLESRTVNAFCLPGGKVAVFTGIMPKFANEAEMACVVAHEIGHAIARHGGERLSWNYMKAAGTLGFSYLGGETWGSVFGVGSEYGVILPFSRSHESEADLIGLCLMAKAGYNPHAAVDFWKRFNTGNSSILDELMSTHPCDATRIEDISSHMSEAEALYRQSAVKRGYGVKLEKGIPVQEAAPAAQRQEQAKEVEFSL